MCKVGRTEDNNPGPQTPNLFCIFLTSYLRLKSIFTPTYSFLMKYLATAFSLLVGTSLFAQNGYEIKVTLKPFKNQYIYLGHYYGKQLPIIDSVKLNANSEGVFKGPKPLGGGIYLIGYPDRA